ncbi:HypC/HybG/HupF family hydrogenase formation chaperone [archaeon]
MLSKSGDRAEILDVHGRQRGVTCPLDAQPGDYVLIGMGFAIEKISEEKYNELVDAQGEIANAAG